MKSLILSCMLSAILNFSGEAQHVKVQMNFPVGISVSPPGPAPFGGAIWIGPEWRWKGGRYIHVPGYWCHPKRHQKNWVPGHWKYSKRGYIWIAGRWR